MYNTQDIANRIRIQVKERGLIMGNMLNELGLGVNIISHLAKGQVISSTNLAKIADYLDCSVDYLLGRSEQNTMADTSITTQEKSLLNKYKKLNTLGKEKADEYIIDLTENEKYTRPEKGQEKLHAQEM